MLMDYLKVKPYRSLKRKDKKRNDCKIFYSSAKPIASDSDIDEAFKYMYQITMTKKTVLVKIGLS